MAARIQYIPNRVIDTNGISDGAAIHIYQAGTTTPVSIYSDSGLSAPLTNPLLVPAGAEVPAMYHDFSGNVRLRVVASDGSVPMDEDPYTGADPASIVTDYGPLSEVLELLATAVPDPRSEPFGVVADLDADDTEAWQAWIDHCADNDLPIVCAPVLWSKITDTLVVPNLGVTIPGWGFVPYPIMLGNAHFHYLGDGGKPGMTIGADASGIYDTDIALPAMLYKPASGIAWEGAAGTSNYLGLTGNHIGILIKRALRCRVTERRVYGWTKGIEYRGCGYLTVFGGHLYDNRYNRVWSTEGADVNASFSNSNKVFGGRLAHTSAANAAGFGACEVFTWDHVNSYRGHNDFTSTGVCFEGSMTVATRPCVLLDGCGNSNHWKDCRVEGVGLWMIANADVTPTSVGSGAYSQTTTYACNNIFEPEFSGMAGQQHNITEVGGACGNRVEGTLAVETEWHSGSLSSVISTTGTAARLNHKDLIFVNESAGSLAATDFRRDDGEYGTSILANRGGIHLVSGGYARVMVPVDATAIKAFQFSYACQAGAAGRFAFMGLDSAGAFLTGIATESRTNPLTGSAYKDELYIKATDCHGNGQSLVGAKCYTTQADGGATMVGDAMRVSCRSEVKTLIAGVQGTTAAALVKGMSLKGYAAPIQLGSTYPTLNGHASLDIVRLVDDSGRQLLSSANPATAGVHGYYQKGDRFGNTAAASAAPAGWACTTTGWLAAAWVLSTAYTVPGRLVTNDSGKIYELVTAGTSASSGGPTGTGTSITDGTCVWKYIGVKAVFVAEANLA